MSKYIDKEKLLDSVYQNTPLIPSMTGMTAEAMRLKIAVLIENFDSIDVVHCKDCKHYVRDDGDDCTGLCTAYYGFSCDIPQYDDAYCSDGERIDNE